MPLLTPGRGLTSTRVFAEFTILASAQGIAVIARSDAIEVRAQRNGVVIASPSGLAISDVEEPKFVESEGRPLPERVAPADLLPSLFQYAAWRGGEYPTFDEGKKALQLALSKAPVAGQTAAQWDLARFYLANSMGVEALGYLELILEKDPSADDDLTFRGVRGAVNYLLRRFDESAKDLLDPAFGLDPSVALWRGALFAQRKEWELARQEFQLGEFAYFEVPPDLSTSVGAIGIGPGRLRQR
jgi:tetratricopeptide (TPR) repeat protein